MPGPVSIDFSYKKRTELCSKFLSSPKYFYFSNLFNCPEHHFFNQVEITVMLLLLEIALMFAQLWSAHRLSMKYPQWKEQCQGHNYRQQRYQRHQQQHHHQQQQRHHQHHNKSEQPQELVRQRQLFMKPFELSGLKLIKADPTKGFRSQIVNNLTLKGILKHAQN